MTAEPAVFIAAASMPANLLGGGVAKPPSEVRLKMGLSQSQFATKFGFPPATLGGPRPRRPLASGGATRGN